MDSTANKRLRSYKEIPFLYSVGFTAVLSALVYLFWFFNLSVYGVFALLLICGLIVALCRDITPIVPVVFLFTQIIRDVPDLSSGLYFYLGGILGIIIGVVVHFVRFKPFNNFGIIGGFTLSVCVIGLATALGGITVGGRNPIVAVVCACVGLSVAFIALFFSKTLGKNSKKRFANTVVFAVIASSTVALVQLLTLLFMTGDPIGTIKSDYNFDAGYAQPMYLANIIARGVPLGIWLSVSNKRYSFLWLFFSFACGIGIILTGARAVLMFAFAIAVICVIYFFPKLEYKLNWICTMGMIVGITMVGIGFFSDNVKQVLGAIIKNGIPSSGRIELWKTGFDRFVSHPIFGVGFDFDLGGQTILNPSQYPNAPFWYQNTFVQALTCMGIVGLIALVPYFTHQYKAMLSTRKTTVTALLFVLLTMQIISMIDAFFFTPQEFLQMMIITFVAIKGLPEKQTRAYVYRLKEVIDNKKNKKTKEKEISK